jgi:hypothetical protein
MRILLLLLILQTFAYADGLGLSLSNSLWDLYSVSGRYNKKMKNSDYLIFMVNYMPHGSTATSLAHDLRFNAGYRMMPFEQYIYLDIGVEYRYLYFDRVGDSFTENSLGAFAAFGLKTGGNIYSFIDLKASTYFWEPKSYKGGNNIAFFENRQWKRSHDALYFISLGIGYDW